VARLAAAQITAARIEDVLRPDLMATAIGLGCSAFSGQLN
jgi:hypothetical protein